MSLFSSTGDAATRFQSVAESAQAPIKNLLNLIGLSDDTDDRGKDKKNDERRDGRSQEAHAQQARYQYAYAETRSGASSLAGTPSAIRPYDGTPRSTATTRHATPTLAPASLDRGASDNMSRLDDWREGNTSHVGQLPHFAPRNNWGLGLSSSSLKAQQGEGPGPVLAQIPPFRPEKEEEGGGRRGMVLSGSADGIVYVNRREREQVRGPLHPPINLPKQPSYCPKS